MRLFFLLILVGLLTTTVHAQAQPPITYTWIDQTHAEVCVFVAGQLKHNGVYVDRGTTDPIVPPACFTFPPPGLIDVTMNPAPGAVATIHQQDNLDIVLGSATLGARPPAPQWYLAAVYR